MSGLRKLVQAGVLCACLLLFGCGGEEFTYQPDHELKPGPGLLSGEDGEFLLIDKRREVTKEVEEEKTSKQE